MATIVYAFLFIREATSVVENLVEAGSSGCAPPLFWLSKKEPAITGSQGETIPEPPPVVVTGPATGERDGNCEHKGVQLET